MQLLLLGLTLGLLPIAWALLARYVLRSAHAGVEARFEELWSELERRRKLLSRGLEQPAEIEGGKSAAEPLRSLLARAEALSNSGDRGAWLAAERELDALLSAAAQPAGSAPAPWAQQQAALVAAAARYDVEARDFNLRLRSLPGNLIAARLGLAPWPLAAFGAGQASGGSSAAGPPKGRPR
jgi:hypothetical protein